MRKTKAILIACIILYSGITSIFAQKGTVASGGVATGTGGSVSYSVGQIDYITETGSGGKLNQGLQQPFEILTGIEESAIHLSATLYPNPTSDYIILNIENVMLGNMSYTLFDMQGKIIAQQKVNNKQTTIAMKDLANASYILNVFTSDNKIKSFTIIKNY